MRAELNHRLAIGEIFCIQLPMFSECETVVRRVRWEDESHDGCCC